MGPYVPTLPADVVTRLRDWHDRAVAELRDRGDVRLSYLGLDLHVPGGVFAPTPMSDLLGRAVFDEVRTSDRVLDMGTGSGVNAILAASRSPEVLGVDINPAAVSAATVNAALNGVAARTRFVVSNVFEAVDGRFDLMIIDPPFRWFRPRDLVEASIADEGYGALSRFLLGAPARLNPGGRILLFFGTSGDLAHVEGLIATAGFAATEVAGRVLDRDGLTIRYLTLKLTARD